MDNAYELPELGRRVERLFYFGSLLLLLCFLLLYFVSATLYVRVENPSDIQQLVDLVAEQRTKMEELFAQPKKYELAPSVTDREKRVAEMRALLGLPPRVVEPEVKQETYAEFLRAIADGFPGRMKLRPETLQLLNPEHPPQRIIADLRVRQKELMQQPVNVWGIESPVIIPMQYGSAQYQVPAAFIASSLLMAATPLVLGWLLSIYTTRQRELLKIRSLRDYKLAFPHVLNFFVVDFSNATDTLRAMSRKRRRFATQELFLARISNAIFRAAVLMFFAVPMLTIICYSAFHLLIAVAEEHWVVLLVGGGAAVLVVLCFALVLQECHLLWDKVFYA